MPLNSAITISQPAK